MFFHRHDGFSRGTVIARHEIDYLRPVVYHPEPLRLETWVDTIARGRFVVRYEVFDGDRLAAARLDQLRHRRLRRRPPAPADRRGARDPARASPTSRRRRAPPGDRADGAVAMTARRGDSPELAPLAAPRRGARPARPSCGCGSAPGRVATASSGCPSACWCRAPSPSPAPRRGRWTSPCRRGRRRWPGSTARRPSRRRARDAEWRGGLPPAARLGARLETVPDDVDPPAGPQPARTTLKEAAAREGVPGRTAAGRGRRRAARLGRADGRRPSTAAARRGHAARAERADPDGVPARGRLASRRRRRPLDAGRGRVRHGLPRAARARPHRCA